nr:LINE-type retrotransposon LIb DNA [Ipomoea batatas]
MALRLNTKAPEDTVGGGRPAGNSTIQVSTSTKSTGKGKQVDTTPVSNTFAYLQDLENLQETPVLLDEDTVPRGAPKPRNHRKNNKGKKQTTVTPGTSSSLTGLFSKGSSNSDQIFVFGNTTGAPPNPSAGAWLRREDYKTLWNNIWNDPNLDLLSTITEVTSQSKEWNKNVFGNIFKRKANLQARIKGVQESVYYPTSKGLQVLENKLIAELDQVLVEEELLWFQKLRRQWVQDGDRNTAFYHKSTLIRRNRARIRMLKINGEWNSDFNDISDHMSNFFIDIFHRRTPAHDIIDLPYEGPKLSHELTFRIDFKRFGGSACSSSSMEDNSFSLDFFLRFNFLPLLISSTFSFMLTVFFGALFSGTAIISREDEAVEVECVFCYEVEKPSQEGKADADGAT